MLGEYLDYKNCKCRKRLGDELVEECTENIDEVKIPSENEHKNKCSSCTLYIVLFSIFFAINIGIGTYFVTTNTWIVIKKLPLDMIMSIKQQFN